MARVAAIGKNRSDLLLEELQRCGIKPGAGPLTLCYERLKGKEEGEQTTDKDPGTKPEHNCHLTLIIAQKSKRSVT